jgi:multiple sugar transport system permease protein
LPGTQLEAARLEGAGALRIWWSVALPQVRPVTLAVAVLAFTAHWGNFVDALLYLRQQELFTLPAGLRTLQLLGPTDFPLLLAGAVVATVPAVLAVLLGQRVFRDDALTGLGTTAGERR